MTIYTCPSHVKWVIDAQNTIVINEQNGKSVTLSDLDATLWSWLTLNDSYDKLLALIDALELSNAEQLLQSALQKWTDAGLLVEKRNG